MDSKLENQSPLVEKGERLNFSGESGRCRKCTVFIGNFVLLGLSHRTALREFWSVVVTLHDCMHACDAAYRDECAGSLGGGGRLKYFGDSRCGLSRIR
jgi:hypothetical protein